MVSVTWERRLTLLIRQFYRAPLWVIWYRGLSSSVVVLFSLTSSSRWVLVLLAQYGPWSHLGCNGFHLRSFAISPIHLSPRLCSLFPENCCSLPCWRHYGIPFVAICRRSSRVSWEINWDMWGALFTDEIKMASDLILEKLSWSGLIPVGSSKR